MLAHCGGGPLRGLISTGRCYSRSTTAKSRFCKSIREDILKGMKRCSRYIRRACMCTSTTLNSTLKNVTYPDWILFLCSCRTSTTKPLNSVVAADFQRTLRRSSQSSSTLRTLVCSSSTRSCCCAEQGAASPCWPTARSILFIVQRRRRGGAVMQIFVG